MSNLLESKAGSSIHVTQSLVHNHCRRIESKVQFSQERHFSNLKTLKQSKSTQTVAGLSLKRSALGFSNIEMKQLIHFKGNLSAQKMKTKCTYNA